MLWFYKCAREKTRSEDWDMYKSVWAPWVSSGPLFYAWLCCLCVTVGPAGCPQVTQHVTSTSLGVLEYPWPQAGHLLIPLPLQICPLDFPLYTFLFVLLLEIMETWGELKIAKMERALWRQFCVCLGISSLGMTYADIDTASWSLGIVQSFFV